MNASTRPVGPAAPQAGWFGKLPAAGDFLVRRLPQSFVHPWDDWLQQGIARGRERFGERWQELYLTFPIWRFLLPPNVLDAQAWYGTLLPSVDRVGRCFPLTICRPLPAHAWRDATLAEIDHELGAFAQAGLIAIDGAAPEQLDALLAEVAPAVPTRAAVGPELGELDDPAAGTRWPLTAPLALSMQQAAERLVVSRLGRRSLWWIPADDDAAGTMRVEHPPLAPELLPSLIAHE